MEIFKLPIQYISHKEVNCHIVNDLELIDSIETPVYSKLFKPSTPEAIRISKQWANYFTTDTSFLTESIHVFKQSKKSASIDAFVQHWKTIQDNKEFKISYQYIESEYLSKLNQSASFLSFVSFYFITSPILFMLTPFIMLLIPFVILRMNGIDFTWGGYMERLKVVFKHHAIGVLITGFKDADAKQRFYLLGVALLYGIQLYSNIYTFYTFYKNITHVYAMLKEADVYLTHTLEQMEHIQQVIQPMQSYELFNQAMEQQKQVLLHFKERVVQVNPRSLYFGNARALFYECYYNEELKTAMEYSIGFHGFLQNIYQLKRKLSKKINPCTFTDKTTFVKAYYPVKRPVKNSYSLEKNKMITGPNASGKTTMLKTTMINVLLSQQIGCGFYTSATICPYEAFYCYINIPDTSGRDSLFQAEARRCKEILSEVVKQERILCIFDELFSGTNPTEAIASSTSMLTFLSNYPTFRFLLTTHFLEICENLKSISSIEMVHMQTTHGQNTYKMVEGISYDKGGLKVLEQFDYPESILKDARMRTK